MLVIPSLYESTNRVLRLGVLRCQQQIQTGKMVNTNERGSYWGPTLDLLLRWYT
jgi:hypothetical protein